MILNYISTHWVEWLFAALLALLGYGYRNINARLKEEQKKNEALLNGVQALLRESIINCYNKYSDKGHMPIYAKESLKHAYAAYSALGGNDVASKLYHKMLNMAEDKDQNMLNS